MADTSNKMKKKVLSTRLLRMMRPLLLCLSGALLLPTAQAAGTGADTLKQIQRRGELRVCIWPDYYGISYRNPKTRQLSGLDIDLSAELARELGVRLQHVDSSFATLIDDLREVRCDIAMFAVAALPQRRQHLAFSQPYLSSGIHAITTRSNRVVRRWEDIDRPGVLVVVQAVQDVGHGPTSRLSAQAMASAARSNSSRRRRPSSLAPARMSRKAMVRTRSKTSCPA